MRRYSAALRSGAIAPHSQKSGSGKKRGAALIGNGPLSRPQARAPGGRAPVRKQCGSTALQRADPLLAAFPHSFQPHPFGMRRYSAALESGAIAPHSKSQAPERKGGRRWIGNGPLSRLQARATGAGAPVRKQCDRNGFPEKAHSLPSRPHLHGPVPNPFGMRRYSAALKSGAIAPHSQSQAPGRKGVLR